MKDPVVKQRIGMAILGYLILIAAFLAYWWLTRTPYDYWGAGNA